MQTTDYGKRIINFGTKATPADIQCCLLAKMGMSTKLICSRTGLTPGQVALRLRQANIRRSDYREGESMFAQKVIAFCATNSQEILGQVKREVGKLIALRRDDE